MRILVVEDNPKMAAALKEGLTGHGHSVDVAVTGGDGEELAISEPYDLLILDRMLPDKDGLDVCRSIRKQGVSAPVIALTALSSTDDKVNGLDAGADDYLTKPFEFDELLARVRALLRRGRATEANILRYEGLELNLRTRKGKRDDVHIKLSSKEFSLLEFLLRNPDVVIDRVTIAQKVWDMSYEPSSNVIDVYISSLRKKIDKGFEDTLIHTVIGAGYRFGLAEGRTLTR
ncbi:MAG: DNA-binding response OmpR family regulator [Planctomycetota bacterium]|jgi:DNA-binding response OmpR family regulator